METAKTNEVLLTNYAEMPLNELKAIDKDTQAALSIKLLAMQANTLLRILKNVLAFFWIAIILLAATIFDALVKNGWFNF